jgi:succinate dehydrogenase / fumarate reductase membrane anchor subunit
MKLNNSPNSGVKTWWAQRISALALVPLVITFVYIVLKAVEYNNLDIIITMFASPFTTLLLALFIGVGLYHGNIGMIEIIEDYIHCHSMKIGLIIALKFISFVSAVGGICAILVLHLSSFNFN